MFQNIADWLNGVQAAGWLSNLSAAATVIGTPAAFLAAYLAYRSLHTAAYQFRLSHMHNLFREYLKLDFDFHLMANLADGQRRHAAKRLRSYKMYVLEEMWLWLESEKERSPAAGEKRRHLATLKGWFETIVWHLEESHAGNWRSFENAKACYSADFFELARTYRPGSGIAPEQKDKNDKGYRARFVEPFDRLLQP